MAKIILRAGKVAIKIIILFAVLGLIFYSIKMLTPARAQSESEQSALADEMALAETYQEKVRYAEAEQIYQGIIKRYPLTDYDFEAQTQLVILYIIWDKLAAAEAALDSLMANYDDEVAVPAAVFDIAHAFSPTRPNKALTLFQQILDTWPNCEDAVRCQVSLVRENLALNNEAGAESAYQELLTKFPGHADMCDAVFTIGEFYIGLNPQKSLELYQEVVDKWPDSVEAMWAQVGVVKANLLLKNEASAWAVYQELLTKFPGHADMSGAVFTIANAYVDLNPQQSLELYQEVVDKWPDSVEAMRAQVGVVKANLLLKNEASAWAVYQELLTKFPGHADMSDAVFTIADAYVDLNPQQSLELYQEVVDKWPDSQEAVMAQMGVVRINIELKNEAAAQSAYQKLITQYSAREELPEAILILADGYLNPEPVDPQRAIELYQYTLQTWPDCRSQDVILARGGIISANIGLDNHATAETEIDDLIAEFSNHPDFPETISRIEEDYFNKIFLVKGLGLDDWLRPVTIWEKVLDSVPDLFYDDPDLYYFIASCYYKLGEYGNALEYFEFTESTWPEERMGRDAQIMLKKTEEKLGINDG